MTAPITRDRTTVLSYGLVAAWAFFLYFLGPVTPLLAEDLAVPLSLAGLTGTALAIGMVLAGWAGPRLVHRFGRNRTVLAASAVFAVGALLLAVVPGFPGVLAAVLVCSSAGAILANTATATLSDRHGAGSATAITEANAGAAWVGLVAPLAIAAAIGLTGTWRPVAVVVALLWVILFLATRRYGQFGTAPTPEPGVGGPRGGATGFPRAFWFSLAAVGAAVAAEFAISFWGALLVVQRTGAVSAAGAAALSALIAGIAVGRTAGSALTRSRGTLPLLLGGAATALIGFVLLLSSTWYPLSVFGLFVTGLGLALLFPLTQSLALQRSGGRADHAIGVIAVMVGVAMGAAPMALGALSALVGVTPAFLVVPVLLVGGALAARHAARLSDAKPPAAAPGP